MNKDQDAGFLPVRQLLATMLDAAGEQAPCLRLGLGLGVLTASLRGVAFLGFIPLFLALQQRDGWTALIWLASITALLLGASLSDWFSRAYDYDGHAAQAGDRLRRELGQHLRRIPLQALYRSRSGELNAAIAGSVDDVINYSLSIALMLVNAIVTPLVVGLGALLFDWRLGLVLLLVFPAVLPVYFWVRPAMTRNRDTLADAQAVLNAETVELIQGLPVLKAANSVGEKAARFNQAVVQVERVQCQAMRAEAPANLLLASMVEIGIMLIAGLGLWLMSGGDLSLMVLAGLLVAVVRFAEPLSIFISMMSVLEIMQSAYLRLQALQTIEPLPQQTPTRTPSSCDIRLTNLSFQYANQDEWALRGVDLTIAANALTALVGPSGCGKTTLIRMLMRYADPQQGSVQIGGVDIRQIEPDALNRLIAVVFQDVYLFDDSIMANIRMGRADASDAEVQAAARAAHCHEFIQRLPQGYYTQVGDIGGNLSGGEKQRISIARALLKDAPIVVLDEPTAALDTQSELAVQQAIDALVQDKTVIVIAHRLSTIVAAQQIVVLVDGQVQEQGNHAELLAQAGRYASLWHTQQADQNF